MKRILTKTTFFLLLLGISANVLASNLDALLQKAYEDIKAENYAVAYQDLSNQEDKYAGNTKFDYLLAVSASETEHFGESLMALDRILAIDPKNTDAHLLQSVVHYKLGNYSQAKKDFSQIKKSNPSNKEVTNIADKYLKSIEEKNKNIVNSFNLGLDFGYNTNVNSSYNGEIDMLGNPLLRTKLEAKGSTFNKIRFNWNLYWNINKKWDMNAGVYLEDQIIHFSSKLANRDTILQDFSHMAILGYASFDRQLNKNNQIGFGLNITEVLTSLKFDHFYANFGANLNYQYKITNNLAYKPSLGVSYTAFDKLGKDKATNKPYTKTQRLDSNKNNFLAINLNNKIQYMPIKKLAILANLDFSYEKARIMQDSHFYEGVGIRNGGDLIAVKTGVTAIYNFTKQHQINGNLNYKLSANLKEDFNFYNNGDGDIKRLQHNFATQLGYAYVPFDFMKVSANMALTYNLSNITYFNYLQFIPTIGLDFYF